MKKASIAAVIAGLILFLAGSFCSGLIATKDLSGSYLEILVHQAEFAIRVFGGVTAICGMLGWIFHKKATKWLSLPTSLLAVGISIVVSLGIHSGISLLSCFFLSNPSRHPIRFPGSACLAMVCFAGFVALMDAYFKVRSKKKSIPGVVLDVLLGLIYCLPFYFVWVATDNIISHLI